MSNVNFPELEREILAFWEREKCFERLVEKNSAIAWKLLQALAKRLRASEPK